MFSYKKKVSNWVVALSQWGCIHVDVGEPTCDCVEVHGSRIVAALLPLVATGGSVVRSGPLTMIELVIYRSYQTPKAQFPVGLLASCMLVSEHVALSPLLFEVIYLLLECRECQTSLISVLSGPAQCIVARGLIHHMELAFSGILVFDKPKHLLIHARCKSLQRVSNGGGLAARSDRLG